MCTVINITIVAMLAYSVLMGLRFNWTVTCLYILIVSRFLVTIEEPLFASVYHFLQIFYAFLMYIEFGISEWLDEHVMINGLVHQVIT